MKRKIYIGAFPPPYGGVTIKNQQIFDELVKLIDIQKIVQFNNKHLIKKIIYILAMFNRNAEYVLGIGSNKNLKLYTKLLYLFNRKLMKRSIVIMMGGTGAICIANNRNWTNEMKIYKHIFVETETMKEQLQNVGINNVSVYPNCRLRPDKIHRIKHRNNRLKCVFFSKITPDKGVDTILNISQRLEDVDIDFFGHIEASYKQNFTKCLETLDNVHYKGVFKVDGDNIYDVLNNYDVLLLPTQCKSEGIPGILVESKIAAITAIVSDINYNSEIITDMVNGIVLQKNDEKHLYDAISKLERDSELLYKLKINALKSAEDFYIDKYIGGLADKIIN